MRLRFLGTGTSFGVPVIGCVCSTCRSDDPRDRRTRSGALVEADGVRLLIDTPPELRLQLVAAGVGDVDAVLFTHDHADHTHGLDDIRAISARRGRPLAMYGPPETLDALAVKFRYVFDAAMRPLPGTTKPEAAAMPLQHLEPVTIAGLEVLPLAVPHGRIRVFGYRIGPLGYVTDAKTVPDEVVDALTGVRVLVLNALFRTPHPTHLSIGESVEVARRVGAPRTFLTHLTHDHLHADLARELPRHIQPAHDGLVVEVE